MHCLSLGDLPLQATVYKQYFKFSIARQQDKKLEAISMFKSHDVAIIPGLFVALNEVAKGDLFPALMESLEWPPWV